MLANMRDREIQCMSKMLTLGDSGSNNSGMIGMGGTFTDFQEQWKVLIYDGDCRDIMSPLLNVGALRQRGVTLHLMLHAEREQIPDAPAVYFIRPTEANLKRVVEDCSKQLYRTVHINFVSRIERPLLEKFAQDLVQNNAIGNVAKIYDQYLDVIALEHNLFTLNMKDSFTAYNEPSLNEQQIRSFMNRCASGLLCATRVLGCIPIIRAPPGGAAEMLAQEFFQMMKENLSARGPAQALFEDSLVHDRARPLLLIIDRMSDLFPVVQHQASYLALISDLLDFKLNRASIEVTEKANSNNNTITVTAKKKSYELSSHTDSFLLKHAAVAFPDAVEASEKDLAEISQRESGLRARPDFNPNIQSDNDQFTALENKGKDLSEALESLPELLHKKAQLEAHTNIMRALLKHIGERDVPTYYKLEQSLLNTAGTSRGTNITVDRSAVLSLLRDPSKGTLPDKARLLVLLASLGDSASLSKATAEEYDQALIQGVTTGETNSGSGGDGEDVNLTAPPTQEMIQSTLAAVNFIRKMIQLQSSPMSRLSSNSNNAGAGAGLLNLLNSAQNKATSMLAAAQTFFNKATPFYATRLVGALADSAATSGGTTGKSTPEDELFCYLDPRARADTAGASRVSKYSDVIVFVLGGGSYAEYFNLQEYLKEKEASSSTASASSTSSLRNIIYGCTDMLSGDDFMKQLERLAQMK